jgi:lichenan operon transcriptional antiterminator
VKRGDLMSDLGLEDRGIQILEIAQKKPYFSLDYLAEVISVSTRTIRNDLKDLNNDLEGFATIVNEKGKGYRLVVSDRLLFDEYIEKSHSQQGQSDSPKRRIAFVFDRLLNSEQPYTLDELAFEMNIGRTTLVNELKKAAVSLETYKLEILGKPNTGIQLYGEELDIRFFIIDNIYDFLYDTYPLDKDVTDEILKISNHHDLESTTQTRLLHFIIVMLDRLLKNHPIEAMNEKYQKLLDTNDYHIASEIITAIEELLPIKVPQNEKLFITIPIAGRRTPTNNRTLADVSVTEDVKKLLESIVEQIGFNKGIILENEDFFKDLQYHLTFMLNRVLFGIRLKNPLIADVKEKYPVAFKMANIAGDVIKSKYDLDVSEDELGYLAFYFGVLIAQSEVKVKRIRKAAVICGTGRGTAKLVAMQLERILNQDTKLELFSETEVTEELLNQYDMVFSTIKLSFDTDIPLLIINEIIDENSVSRKIEDLTISRNFNLKDDQSHHSIISQLINQDKFFLLNHGKSYQDNLFNMVQDLVAKGYLDEGFTERLHERQQKGSMIFDRYIALPHTFNKNSDQIELAIGVFPEAVMADGKEIKLVFLLGLPEHQMDHSEHLLVKLYDEIIRIATKDQVVDELAGSTSYEEMKQVLAQFGDRNV